MLKARFMFYTESDKVIRAVPNSCDIIALTVSFKLVKFR